MESKKTDGVDRPPEKPLDALRRELADERKRSEELLSRLKYTQADLENMRKRTDKELREAGESLARSLVSRLLVVQDELDLAVKHAEGETGGEALKEGVTMVRRNLLSALESVGVEQIEAAGKPFDPTVHEAVERVHGKGKGPDMVVEEVRPGFVFRGQVLRPSMVKVETASKSPEEEARVNE